MSNLGFVLDTPLPDVTVREGDVDPMVFTLTQADGSAIDLSGKVVKIRLKPSRGAQVTVQYATDDPSPKLVVTDPARGVVRLTPEATTFSSLLEPYRAYFLIGTGPQTVPQERDLWIAVLPKF